MKVFFIVNHGLTWPLISIWINKVFLKIPIRKKFDLIEKGLKVSFCIHVMWTAKTPRYNFCFRPQGLITNKEIQIAKQSFTCFQFKVTLGWRALLEGREYVFYQIGYKSHHQGSFSLTNATNKGSYKVWVRKNQIRSKIDH